MLKRMIPDNFDDSDSIIFKNDVTTKKISKKIYKD